MTRLGPMFGQELTAAGLVNVPLSWTQDGEIFGRENLTPEQNATLDAVIAAHDPTKTIVPTIISDRQFFQALALQGLISEHDALAAVRTGTLPPPMRDFVAGITNPQEHFAVEMVLSGATQFERGHPLVGYLGQVLGWSDAQIDDLWRVGATL